MSQSDSHQRIPVDSIFEKPFNSQTFSGPFFVLSQEDQIERQELLTAASNCFYTLAMKPKYVHNNALIVTQLFSEQQLRNAETNRIYANEKISRTIRTKDLFRDTLNGQNSVSETTNAIDSKSLYQIKRKHIFFASKEPKRSQHQESPIQKDVMNPTCIVLCSYGHDIQDILEFVPQHIIPLTKYDILAYQKQRLHSNYKFYIAEEGFQQQFVKRIETEVFLNWGSRSIMFEICLDSNEISEEQVTASVQKKKCNKVVLRPSEILIIHGGCEYSWKIASEESDKIKQEGQQDQQSRQNRQLPQVAKMISWQLLPRNSVQRLLQNFENAKQIDPFSQSKFIESPLPILRCLIDYCFHQLGQLEETDTELIYGLINFLGENIAKEKESFQKLFENSKAFQNALANRYGVSGKKSSDQKAKVESKFVCCKCHKSMINYIIVDDRSQEYCSICFEESHQKESKKVRFYLSKSTIQEGFSILVNIFSIKNSSAKSRYVDLGLLKYAEFQNYEKDCGGTFMGATKSGSCSIGLQHPNKKTTKDLKDKLYGELVDKTLQSLAHNEFSCKQPAKLIKYYSTKTCETPEQKQIYLWIVEQATKMCQLSSQELIKEILPNYEEKNLLLEALAILQQKGSSKPSGFQEMNKNTSIEQQ